MVRLPITVWKRAAANQDLIEMLVNKMGLAPAVSHVLSTRDIADLTQAERFLSPSLTDLHNPFALKGMEEGVNRVVRAIYGRERILICGDYDVDGVTSVAILYDFLQQLTPQVHYFIPDRLDNGYGLSLKTVEEAREEGRHLIITVDCGSSDYEAIRAARSMGLDVVVLDHHETHAPLPEATALINPKQPGCSFPFRQLAAVGIVFNFLIALRCRLRKMGFFNNRPYPNLKNYLDLVALGTIADIVPLVDENRIFVKFGLDLLTAENRVGIKVLKEVAFLSNQVVDSTRASFSLIPRINAAGRVAHASEALKLLLSTDIHEARLLARNLDDLNRKRQSIERKILEGIIAQVDETLSRDDLDCLILASPDWHPGVLGIVASRLVDRYKRPAILISLKDGLGRGSGRSLGGFNIYKGLERLDSYLLSYGGHQYAAGISIREEAIPAFARDLEKIASEDIKGDYLAHTQIDSECLLRDIDEELMRQLEMLAPFGPANPEPVFCDPEVRVSNVSVVGKNHLRLKLSADGQSHSSIWFGKADLRHMPYSGIFAAAYTPKHNYYQGTREIQIKLRDLSGSPLDDKC